MSLSLSSLRSHFFKHLELYNRASSSFSFHRRSHRRFFVSPPVDAGQLQQQRPKLVTTAANYSTVPLNNGLTSPYLSVQICCPKHLSVSSCLFLPSLSLCWLRLCDLCCLEVDFWMVGCAVGVSFVFWSEFCYH